MTHDSFHGLKLLGAQDVQRVLDVTRGTIQAIIRDKLIPAQKTSAGWVFPEGEVLKYQAERKRKAAAGDRRVRIRRAVASS